MEENKQALITVIVPVYNVARYLADCIESVLQQEFTQFELLLVNDGSTDNSLVICEQYQQRDPRVRVLSQANAGPGAARNRGIEETRTPWLCFLDSDDVIGPRYLGEFFAHGIPEQDTLVMQGMRMVTEHGREDLSVLAYPDQLITASEVGELIPKYRILHSGFPVLKLYSTELIRTHSLRFDTSISFHEDHLFVLAYMMHIQQIRLCSRTEYLYVQYQGSLSKKLHPYQESERALGLLRSAFDLALAHFDITDAQYRQEVNGFLNVTLFRTIEYAYRGNASTPEQQALLKRLRAYRGDIASACIDPLTPQRERAMRWIYLHFPISLQHLSYKAYYSLLKSYHSFRRK